MSTQTKELDQWYLVVDNVQINAAHPAKVQVTLSPVELLLLRHGYFLESQMIEIYREAITRGQPVQYKVIG